MTWDLRVFLAQTEKRVHKVLQAHAVGMASTVCLDDLESVDVPDSAVLMVRLGQSVMMARTARWGLVDRMEPWEPLVNVDLLEQMVNPEKKVQKDLTVQLEQSDSEDQQETPVKTGQRAFLEMPVPTASRDHLDSLVEWVPTVLLDSEANQANLEELDPRVVKGHLARQVITENRELKVLLETKVLQALWAPPVHQAQLVMLDRLAQQENLDHREFKDSLVSVVHRVPKANLDPLVQMDLKDLRDQWAPLALLVTSENPELMVPTDNRESLVLLVPKDILDATE